MNRLLGFFVAMVLAAFVVFATPTKVQAMDDCNYLFGMWSAFMDQADEAWGDYAFYADEVDYDISQGFNDPNSSGRWLYDYDVSERDYSWAVWRDNVDHAFDYEDAMKQAACY